LLVQAYNADESETRGVGRIITRLERWGVPADRITCQTVAELNAFTRDNPWLSDVNRLAYIGRVVDGYVRG
jgi:hypothetical protein